MTTATRPTTTARTLARNTWLGGAALGVLFLSTAAEAASPDCARKCPVAHHRKHVAATPAENPLTGEVAALKAQVAALEQRLDASDAAARQAQASAAQAQSSAEAAQAAARNDQLAINQIPGQVDAAVAALPKPKTDALYFNNGVVKFTPGGFIAAESVYRTRGTGSDFSLPFGSIPYENSSTKSALTGEWRQTARQSRISGLAEANVDPNVKLTAYGEFDFLGAAQTANSNESNSYNLRIRLLYTTVDFKDEGFSVLAGQNWSLATLQNDGISPRHEVIPQTIDSQYVVGFVWERQPQLRITENFGNGLWVALSAETPQTDSIGGTAVLLPGIGSVTFNQPALGGSLFNATNSYSFNHVPDLIGKVAWDGGVGGHHLHVEGFGLWRDFYDRVGTGCNATGTSCTAFHNVDTSGGGGGFGVVAQLAPGLLDAQLSGLFGSGLGRYGSSQFSDVFEQADGALGGIRQSLFLAGLTAHATPTLDIWTYYGQEQDGASSYAVAGVPGGYGNPLFSNLGGCELTSELACSGNTQAVKEFTVGLWDNAYSGDYGRFRLGLQYVYVKRTSFDGEVDSKPLTFGQVTGDDNMVYTSIRYYPFQR
jgi:hypothetical protein